MFDINFLKIVTVLYVEDDKEIRDSFRLVFDKIFKNVIVATDGIEALDIYENTLKLEKSDQIDVVISDINMPNMNGIEFLKKLRNFNKDIPFIFTTGHTNNEYLLEAIENDISHYVIKPVDIRRLIVQVQNVCKTIYEHRLAVHNHNESKEYLKIIDKVAIVSKTDTKGVITFVNDIFCDVAGYSRDELIGKHHNIVRHPDMPSSAFKNMWSTIKSGEEWYGKVKNRTKDGEAYHVNATIFPLYDNMDTHIEGYMAIRFLTTQEENQKREFKTQVRELVTKYNFDIKELRANKSELEIKLKSSDIEFLENRIKTEKEKSDKLNGQINYYEDSIKTYKIKIVKQTEVLNENTIKSNKDKQVLIGENNILKNELNKMKNENEMVQLELDKRSKEFSDQSKTIRDLHDVIKHREKQLGI